MATAANTLNTVGTIGTAVVPIAIGAAAIGVTLGVVLLAANMIRS